MSPNYLHSPDQGMRRGLQAEAAALLSGLAIFTAGAVAPSGTAADPSPGHEGPAAIVALLDTPGGTEAPTSGSSHHRKHRHNHAKKTPARGTGGAVGPETTSPSTGTAGSESTTNTNGNGGTPAPDSDPGGAVAA